MLRIRTIISALKISCLEECLNQNTTIYLRQVLPSLNTSSGSRKKCLAHPCALAQASAVNPALEHVKRTYWQCLAQDGKARWLTPVHCYFDSSQPATNRWIPWLNSGKRLYSTGPAQSHCGAKGYQAVSFFLSAIEL